MNWFTRLLNLLDDFFINLFPRPNYDEPIETLSMNKESVKSVYLWDTPEQVRHSCRLIADEEGLTMDQKNKMSQTIHCESGYIANISVHNCLGADGEIHSVRAEKYTPENGKILSTDNGVCQWNDKYHAHEISPDEALHNPEKAVRLMCKYVKDGQLKQWVCFSSGRSKNFTA